MLWYAIGTTDSYWSLLPVVREIKDSFGRGESSHAHRGILEASEFGERPFSLDLTLWSSGKREVQWRKCPHHTGL